MTTALDDYDLPFHNASGETIPPFAVMQQTWQGAIADRDYFRAIKPNGIGKKFALNGPLPIPAGGQGRGTIARGSFALYDPSITPAADEELGPLPGQWHLGRLGSGFIVDGEIAGSPPSLPGFPTVASTLRVRVTIQPAAGKSEQLVRFELKDDKALPSPPFGAAYLLDDNDVKITGANNQPLEIIVIDRLPTVYAGFGAYTDKKYGAQPGNRGWAQFKSGDYGGTGKLGYEIIAMDGQARFIEGTLAEEWLASDNFARVEVTDYWGAAPNNRPPKTKEHEFGGGTTGTPSNKKNIIEVYDTLGQLSGVLAEGEKIRAVWDELRLKYVLTSQRVAPTLLVGWVNKDIPKATVNYQALTVTPGTTESAVTLLEWLPDGSLKSTGEIKTGINKHRTDITASTTEPQIFDGYLLDVDGEELGFVCVGHFLPALDVHMIQAVATAASSGADFFVSAVEVIYGERPTTNPLPIKNLFAWTFEAGAKVVAARRTTSSGSLEWVAIQVSCPLEP